MSETKLGNGQHHCAVGDDLCKRVISTRLLMCPKHWRMVPGELQSALWRAFRARSDHDRLPVLSRSYLEAREACIVAVREKIAIATRPPDQHRMPL